MKKENLIHSSKRFSCKNLYSLHYPSDYADNLEKKRDRQWFLKMQRLEKKSQELREQLELLLKEHSSRIMATRQLATITHSISNRSIQKRDERKQFEDLQGLDRF